MLTSRLFNTCITTCSAFLLITQTAIAQVPPASRLARSSDLQRQLIAPCDSFLEVRGEGWRMTSLRAERDESVKAKLPPTCLRLTGHAHAAGAKADFTFTVAPHEAWEQVGVWVHLEDDANVDRLGFQVSDHHGEAFIFTKPVTSTGWQWVEFDLTTATLKHAYPQTKGNRKIDGSIKRLSVVWFARQAGKTYLTIDAVTGGVRTKQSTNLLGMQALGNDTLPRHHGLQKSLLLTNRSSKPITVDLSHHLQRDSIYYDYPAPHAVHGSDHALDGISRTIAYGQAIAHDTLTDGIGWSKADANARKEERLEVTQLVELSRERKITHLAFTGDDANWTWNCEMTSSRDGKTYRPIEGLGAIDLHRKWGRVDVNVPQPFVARYLKLRYWKDGQPAPRMRMPSALSIYDGLEDETFEPPALSHTITSGRQQVRIPARSFTVVTLKDQQPLETGRYLLTLIAEQNGRKQMIYAPVYVQLAEVAQIDASSRFGMNTSNIKLASMIRQLGVGWVRFENMKWPHCAPEPGRFAFDGSVSPWNVPHDEIFKRYHDLGMTTLPYLYQVPVFESTHPPSAKRGRRLVYPPKDNAKYGEFTFQVAARYGSKKHPPSVLLTDDKVSGLGYMNTFELWNEANLNNPKWGHFVGTLGQYFEMYKVGALGVKRADPTARVASTGWAGISLDFIDRMRTYRYADGTTPLDYTDVLSVHYYTGRSTPELNTLNTNIDRSGKSKGGKPFEDQLQRLVDWRDQYRPGMRIWMTETGYDANGGWGVGERLKAAWVPRVSMVCLAAGIDKVMLFRERGSGNTRFAASGVLRNDNSHDPSWFTFGTMLRQLRGVDVPADQFDLGNTNVRVYAWQTDQETILTAWAVKGTDMLKLKLGRCTVTDAFGHTRTINVDGNLPLSEMPLYIRNIPNQNVIHPLIDQARKREKQRVIDRDRQAKKRVVLFDFGSTEDVGAVHVGTHRPAVAVTKNNVWSTSLGYGFTPGVALRDENGRWQREPLEQDTTRINAETAFQFTLPPGKYQLQIKAALTSNQAALHVTGIHSETSLNVTKEKPLAELIITTTGGPIRIQPNRPIGLRWIAAIEND